VSEIRKYYQFVQPSVFVSKTSKAELEAPT